MGENNQKDNDDKDDTNDVIRILEIAGGSGVHMAYFAEKLTQSQQPFFWQSTDPDESARQSQLVYMEELPSEIQASISKTPLSLTLSANGIQEPETRSFLLIQDDDEQDGKDKDKKQPPQKLSSSSPLPSPCSLDLIININMIHISPWEATLGLFKTAQQTLKHGGILYLYGPYKQNGTASPSNLKFDQFLKMKDPGYGLRNLEDVLALAESDGRFELLHVSKMPANNLSVVLR